MPINQTLLAEFDQEMASTRKTLERVPEHKFDWKPHAKSGTMIWLAGHVANIPGWGKETLERDSFDIAPPGEPPAQPELPRSRNELLALFDRNIAEGRAVLAKASDEHLMKPWSLLSGGKTIFTMPRVAVFRSFVMNHLIHHRAQLNLYLRLLGIAPPSI